MNSNFNMFFLLFFYFLPLLSNADLQFGFYSKSCPMAESTIRAVVQKHFNSDRSITAALLRMHFHDCFVRGCDASILIDSTKKVQSEKAAFPNLTVRGYNIITEAKKKLEQRCPSTVSCADIIAVATRDAVALAGGLNYNVPTGRRDGLVSLASEVNLPGPRLSIAQASQAFKAKGLTLVDMVTLLGAHTVGSSQCGFFKDRLSDFRGSGRPDPNMEPLLRAKLGKICSSVSSSGKSSKTSADPTVFLDQNTSFVFDNQFYTQILEKKGVLQIDQELAMDGSTKGIVNLFRSNPRVFKRRFADAMVKLGKVQVLVGNSGEIRKKCSVFNKKNPKK